MDQRRRRERGSVLIYVVIGAATLIALAALSTETGRAWHTKNQLQAAADSSSLAGVGNLLTNNFQTVDESGAITAATNMVGNHSATGTTLGVGPPTDVEVGSWDLATETFTPLPGNTDPNQVRAVHVVTRRDGVANGPMQTIFGQVVGVASIDVNSDAVAQIDVGAVEQGKDALSETHQLLAIDRRGVEQPPGRRSDQEPQ